MGKMFVGANARMHRMHVSYEMIVSYAKRPRGIKIVREKVRKDFVNESASRR